MSLVCLFKLVFETDYTDPDRGSFKTSKFSREYIAYKGYKLETHLSFLFADVGNIDLKYDSNWIYIQEWCLK